MSTVFDPHDIAEKITYYVDFSPRIASGDTLSGATWSPGAGLEVVPDSENIDATNGIASARLQLESGGAAGDCVEVSVLASTTAGEEPKEVFTVILRELPVYPSL